MLRNNSNFNILNRLNAKQQQLNSKLRLQLRQLATCNLISTRKEVSAEIAMLLQGLIRKSRIKFFKKLPVKSKQKQGSISFDTPNLATVRSLLLLHFICVAVSNVFDDSNVMRSMWSEIPEIPLFVLFYSFLGRFEGRLPKYAVSTSIFDLFYLKISLSSLMIRVCLHEF